MTCNGCDKDFREEDVAPYQRNADDSQEVACRHCIGSWIKLGILNPSIPFWARKQGLGRL